MKTYCRPLRRFIGWVAAWVSISTGYAQVDWPNIQLTQVGGGTEHPTFLTHAGDGSGRLFVAEQPGYIRILKNDAFLAQPFLNLTNRVSVPFAEEDGLLSLAFPANYAAKGYFYVYYNRLPDGACVLSRFHVSTNADLADPLSEQVLLTITKPYLSHNGGFLAFGPDGYLYLATGDHRLGDLHPSFAQDPSSLWGKTLRLDVESVITNSYRIPADNPFIGNAAYQPEIWALGFRNPVRGSFDRVTGDLYIGDVGQNTSEEIDFLPAPLSGGKNFGWRLQEGAQDYDVPVGFDLSLLTPPVVEFLHSDGYSSLTAGSVYRGPASARMNGLFFYGDFITGILGAVHHSGTNWQKQTLSNSGLSLVAFGEDESGRLYLADYQFFGPGGIYRVEDNGQAFAPELNPPPYTPGTTATAVHLTSLSPGVTIHYTTNGLNPTPSDLAVLPGGSVPVASGTFLLAQAYRGDLTPSEVVGGLYTLQVGAPSFTPPQGPISNGTFITVQTITPGAIIRYTLDGSAPGTNSILYTAPFLFNTNQTLRARAFKAGFDDSSVATFDPIGVRLTGLRIDNNQNFVVSWLSLPGTLYELQYSTDLVSWHHIGGFTSPNKGIQSYTTHAIQPAMQRRYFRILVSTP